MSVCITGPGPHGGQETAEFLSLYSWCPVEVTVMVELTAVRSWWRNNWTCPFPFFPIVYESIYLPVLSLGLFFRSGADVKGGNIRLQSKLWHIILHVANLCCFLLLRTKVIMLYIWPVVCFCKWSFIGTQPHIWLLSCYRGRVRCLCQRL